MRVMYTTMAQVKDGQFEGAVGVAAEAAGLMRSHGAEVRFFLASAAGEQVNTTLFSIEYESPETMGESFDKMSEDPAVQALTMRLATPESPSMVTSQSMAMELPIRSPKAGQGSILEVHTSTIHPGRMEDFITQSSAVCDFVEANGAVNARVIQLTYAGMASGMTALTWEVENNRAHAALGAAWFSDEGLALQATTNGPNPPSTTLSSALYNAIPL